MINKAAIEFGYRDHSLVTPWVGPAEAGTEKQIVGISIPELYPSAPNLILVSLGGNPLSPLGPDLVL